MRINKYKPVKYEKSLALVKECGVNYPHECNSPLRITEMIKELFLDNACEEYVYVVGFNLKLKPIGVFELSHGSISISVVSMKSLYTRLLLIDAACFCIIHNHPTGDLTPSKEDMETTKRIFQTSQIMDMTFLDHIIIGDDKFLSMKEKCSELFI